MSSVPSCALVTERLRLVAADSVLMRAELEGRKALSSLLGVQIPDNWPPGDYVDALPAFTARLGEAADSVGWYTWYSCLKEGGLIGAGGFKGPPGLSGSVELGYSVLPQYRKLGYASEAASALVLWAFSHDEVGIIVAETAEENHGSIAVLGRAGFCRVGRGSEDGMIRFQLCRADCERKQS